MLKDIVRHGRDPLFPPGLYRRRAGTLEHGRGPGHRAAAWYRLVGTRRAVGGKRYVWVNFNDLTATEAWNHG